MNICETTIYIIFCDSSVFIITFLSRIVFRTTEYRVVFAQCYPPPFYFYTSKRFRPILSSLRHNFALKRYIYNLAVKEGDRGENKTGRTFPHTQFQ